MRVPSRVRRGIRVSDETHRVTTFELLFDLVFVFAFTQVTGFMAHEHSALGILQAMIILALLWWSWASYSWLANQTHVDEGVVRLGMAVAMGAMFVVALVIPESFHDQPGGLNGPLVLVIAAFIVRLAHFVLYLLAAGGDIALRRQVVRSSVSLVVATLLLLAGIVIDDGQLQTWFWLAALIADIVLTWVTSSNGSWRLPSAAHWAERYGLVVILALGESIVAIGTGAAAFPISVPVVVGALLGIALSISLWWVYFDRVSEAGEHALAAVTGNTRAAIAVAGYTYGHLLLIAGIMISALGVETVLAHVESGEPLDWFGAAALCGGTSLYLAVVLPERRHGRSLVAAGRGHGTSCAGSGRGIRSTAGRARDRWRRGRCAGRRSEHASAGIV